MSSINKMCTLLIQLISAKEGIFLVIIISQLMRLDAKGATRQREAKQVRPTTLRAPSRRGFK